ncbi:PREDICTED: N-terminal Xaa-Pro-Lys N-methyltransferase 1-like [Rhagoletis zephyria]|uniref:N-terminal Xaa-Pro-Lys N-methyltransferase 1-like n=1 Tax=Rhagoletis zephyria TaxID=28612 RepID=UPI0008119EBA|nr:PREDICTED: N-terminal Xaa-Pro-Lys N-methyltransferase 1-like [Rhagoletis zephyria]
MSADKGVPTENENFYSKSKFYWRQVEASCSGMLGGFTNVNTVDADESLGLLKKILGQATFDTPSRVLDCGAGIGRVSKYVLSHFFDEIDLLEQNELFLQQSKNFMGEKYSKVKHLFAQGMQDFQPLPDVKYSCIWLQWCIGYINDADFVIFLEKCAQILTKPNGFIVIKDNVTRTDECVVDEEDGSVARSDEALRTIFAQVGQLQVKCVVKQKKMPKGLFPVKMYVLKLKDE